MANSPLRRLLNGPTAPAFGTQVTGTLGNISDNVVKAFSSVTETAGKALDNSLFESGEAGDFIKTLPVSNNMSIVEFFDALDDPFEKDGTNKALAEITGINIWGTVESLDPTKIDKKVAIDRVNEYVAGVEAQIVRQFKACLEKWVQELFNKNEGLDKLLDIEGAIINEIGKLRNKVKKDVEDEIERYAYDKVKLQQLALLRQELTKAIRKMCPGHNSPPKVKRLSPSLIRKIEDDQSWSIVDGVGTLEENIRAAETELAYRAQRSDSTAKKLQTLSKDAISNIRNMSIQQTVGNTDKSMSSYVSTDGTLV